MHPPKVASLDEAHAAIEQWEFYSRKMLDEAQKLAVEHMMAHGPGGMWAARTTGRAESRQNGKGDEVEVVEAWDLTQRAAPIVHTAHEIPTAKSAHQRLVGHLYGHRDLRRRVKQVRYANGDQSIEMLNGGIIVYRTRTAGGGRGLDDIARLVVDEAQWAQPEQLASSTPILAVNPNPQTNFTGSAGIENRSDWWWSLRKRALRNRGGSFAWLEHSAESVTLGDRGRVSSVAPEASDWAAWRRANPAFPERISADFLLEQLETLGPELFAREHLCVWDPIDVDGSDLIFGPGRWAACRIPAPEPRPDSPVFFLDASPKMTSASVGVAAVHDGRPHLELSGYRGGADWLVGWAAGLRERHPSARFAVLSTGAVTALLPALKEVDVEPEQFTVSDMGRACGHLQKLVADSGVTFSEDEADPVISRAVSVAVQRDVGDELWTWSKRKSGDISPLVAVTGAAWLLENEPAYAVLDSVW